MEIGKGVSIIIVDAGGTPMCLERVNDAAPATTFIAEGKAVASVMMGRDSGALATLAERFPPITSVYERVSTNVNGRFLALQGAVVILDDGAVNRRNRHLRRHSEEDDSFPRRRRRLYS